MKLKTILAAAIFASTAASQVFAAPVAYICEYTSHSRSGWIPPKAWYEIDEEKGTARVFDGYVKTVQDGPLGTNLIPLKTNKFKLKYKLTGIPTSNSSAAIASYNIRLDVAKGRSSLSVIVHGSDNRPSGTGRCEVYKD